MYLKGSNLSMNRQARKRPHFFRIFVLLVLVGLAIYANQVLVPDIDPLFIPTLTPTRPPQSILNEAQELLSQGRLMQAIPVFQQVLQSDPQNVNVYILLARLQVLTGDYESAISTSQDALLLSENNSMAHAVHGWALGISGRFLEGEPVLLRAIEIDPNNGMAYAFLSEVLTLRLMAGQGGINTLDQAVDASRNAVALAPNTLETHRARGLILEFTGNSDEAIFEYRQAILINDNIPDLHLALGRTFFAIGDYANATESYNRANTLNPADPLPDLYISRAYATTGDFTNAVQYASLAVKDRPNDATLLANLGTMHFRRRDFANAIPPLRLAIRGGTAEDGNPVEPIPLNYGRPAEFYYFYGLALARAGECVEALQVSQTIQLGVPNDSVAIFNAQEIVNICQPATRIFLPFSLAQARRQGT